MKRWRDLRRDEGSMVLAIMMITLVAGFASLLVATTLTQSSTVRHDQKFTDVLPAGDAGISRGLFMLNNGLIPPTTSTPIIEGSQSANWYATKKTYPTAPPSYLITSQTVAGTVGTQRTLQAEAYQSSRFAYGAFADTSVVFRGGNSADSYNSNNGTLTKTGHGTIGTNGSVTLNGSASADQVVLYNWAANPSGSRCSGGPCPVYTTVNAPFDISSSAATQFIKTGLSNCSSQIAFQTSTSATHALPSGTWCASSLNLDLDTTVSAPTVIFVSGNVTTSHHLNINYASGVEPIPANLQIYMLGSTYDMANHTTIAAAIWAPLATCNGGAQSVVYGSLVCGSISNVGGWTFHYDDALAQVGAGDFRIRNYREN
jgi:hypothetical protein